MMNMPRFSNDNKAVSGVSLMINLAFEKVWHARRIQDGSDLTVMAGVRTH